MNNVHDEELKKVSGGQDEFHGYKVGPNCIGCGSCISFCPVESIHIEGIEAVINQEECVQCGSCADACPTEAIKWY